MKQCSRLKQLCRYGVTDDTGKVLISPIFDNIIITDHFVLAKKGGKNWGLVKDFELVDRIEYVLESILIFDDILWFRSHGCWSAMNSRGEIVVKGEYSSVSRLKNADVIEAYKFSGAIEYFTVKGIPLSWEYVDIIEISEFELGYAIARGCEKKTGMNKFFVVSGESGSVLDRWFNDVESCRLCLQELRDDYVWSIRRRG